MTASRPCGDWWKSTASTATALYIERDEFGFPLHWLVKTGGYNINTGHLRQHRLSDRPRLTLTERARVKDVLHFPEHLPLSERLGHPDASVCHRDAR